MALINEASISKKLKQWSLTKPGKQRMSDAIRTMKKQGKRKTAGGSEILTIPMMQALAQELIHTLKTTAASYNLAPSVMKHFDSLDYAIEDSGSGDYECYIYFTDDLSRNSLETDDSQGEGINNIVALFNNGYVASAPKYGWWNGHSPTGESVYRSGQNNNSAYVRSTQARPSLHFMQAAIEDFYKKYKSKYKMSVLLNGSEYDGNYAGSLNGKITQI